MGAYGLSDEEARARLSRYGKNELKKEKEPGLLRRFAEKLDDPLIYILLVAAAVSLFLKEMSDACIILVVVILNAVIGMVQEGKARQALLGLEKLTAPHAFVIRNGHERVVDAAELVPGDLIRLEAGGFVPADAKIITSVNLKCDEASLSGESVPVEKGVGELVYMSTYITYGRGTALITATGMDTRMGRICKLVSTAPSELTPLQKRLNDLGKVLSILAVGLCALLFLLAILQKRPVGEMLLTAISLAVAAVPEGLAAVVTIVLALSVTRLVKLNTIVKRLPSVETLGCVSVVCSDKTGTLTQNRMRVMKVWSCGEVCMAESLRGVRDRRLIEALVLCNDANISGEERMGDPTELALLDLGKENGIDKNALSLRRVRVDEIPFSSETKRMCTLHRHNGRNVEYMKGALEGVLKCCDKIWNGTSSETLTGEMKKRIMLAAEGMSGDALRVLSAAVKETDVLTEKGLTFLGFVGMLDPVRPEAAEAVSEFRAAGVKTVMITGDAPGTAVAIGRELGICGKRMPGSLPGAMSCDNGCITGDELDALSDEELSARAEHINVFARVSPEHKCRIVKAFRANGRVIAMTGDGTNDAPALRLADVGIAMGDGTDVARNAGDLVLADDNFATIRDAICEGRSIYKNIKKSIVFLLSSNFGEIITMLAAVAAYIATPLKPAHILWINLITDSLPALALGCDENDREALMKRPPRDPNESLFAGGALFLTCFYGLLIALISLGAFLFLPVWLLCEAGCQLSLDNIRICLSQPQILLHAQTYAFTVLGVSQLFHAIGMRDVDKSVFRMNPADNPVMLIALFIGIALQVAVTEVPILVGAFQTAKLTLSEWGVLLGISLMPVMAHEILVDLRFLKAKKLRK